MTNTLKYSIAKIEDIALEKRQNEALVKQLQERIEVVTFRVYIEFQKKELRRFAFKLERIKVFRIEDIGRGKVRYSIYSHLSISLISVGPVASI